MSMEAGNPWQIKSCQPLCVRKEGNMLGKLKDNKGFTLIELLMVFVVLGILAQMALTFMRDLKSRSCDLMSISDGRNLMTVIRDNFINLDDVDYTAFNGSEIGVQTTGGVARPGVFTLSPGVRIFITPGSESPGIAESGNFEAWLSNVNGSEAPGLSMTGTGKREFYYLADETTNPPSYSLATF